MPPLENEDYAMVNMEPEKLPSDPIEIYQYALSLHQSGRLAEAKALYQQLLPQFPDNPLLLTGLGIIALQHGNLPEGIAQLERSLKIETAQPLAHQNLGLALRSLNRLEEALACFDHAIEAAPDFADAHNFRGMVLHDLKRMDEAMTSYGRAISLAPLSDSVFNNRGVALLELGRLEEAREDFDHATRLNPNAPEAYSNRGKAFNLLGRYEEAIQACHQAIGLNSKFAPAHNNLGIALYNLGRYDEALEKYKAAIQLTPQNAEIYNNQGAALRKLKRPEEALECLNHAIRLNPAYAEAYYNRGNVLHDLGRLEEALESYGHAIKIKPAYVEAYNNLGLVLRDLNRVSEALEKHDKAISLAPADVLAHWNKSLLKLLAGDFPEGWKLYEWRWQGPQKESARNFGAPLWLGDQPIAGKTLLVYFEQGLGDFIQFCRYIPMVEDLGGKVVLELPQALIPLVSTLRGSRLIVRSGEPLPPIDYQCPIMSLPFAFQTTLETIPAFIPYLHADAGRQARWRQHLGTRTKPRIGLVWAGNPGHANDRNRSIPAGQLKPLLAMPLEFHVLQKIVSAEEKDFLSEFRNVSMHSEELGDFSDTAALIQEMDLVISADTSVAHLSGALGKQVWILLPYAPDFRWMLDRADSPWYPTATLIRQPAIGDWPAVIAETALRLRAMA